MSRDLALFDAFFCQHPEWRDDLDVHEGGLLLPLPGWIALCEWVLTWPDATPEQREHFGSKIEGFRFVWRWTMAWQHHGGDSDEA